MSSNAAGDGGDAGSDRDIETTKASTSSTSSTGLEPRVAAFLAYLAWWVTGLLFLYLERENRYVRFHARQSVIAFGAISAVSLGLIVASFLVLLVSVTGLQILLRLSQIVAIAGLALWPICLIKAYRGERWKIPIAGHFAERLEERA